MSRLFVTADIHGDINVFEKLLSLTGIDDTLIIAGDLFDTKYGSKTYPGFAPEKILNLFSKYTGKNYYVYGNCDDPMFFRGGKDFDSFVFSDRKIFVSHGHLPRQDISEYDIIIEGHSHVPVINTLYGKIFVNPGSPVRPRNNFPTYAVITEEKIEIINFLTGSVTDKLVL